MMLIALGLDIDTVAVWKVALTATTVAGQP